ncbi:hypothetical protein L1D19_05900 [Vibrio natriegens]|uniref:hypothetical protein n=1 Tax=Vibrio natriegens TaxID=691 RepID=UPI001EFC5134|nr:hypothetical protein [Vibrio natriegens]MCG9699665.1 hypothetical protein [Vibrio natriegens]
MDSLIHDAGHIERMWNERASEARIDTLTNQRDKLARLPAHVVQELKESNKQSFYSGLAVALQSISLFDNPTIAEEIINGLGSEKESFYSYLASEGGIDAETLTYLKKNGM